MNRKSSPVISDPAVGPVMLTAEQIHERVTQLGAQISADYASKDPVVIGILTITALWLFVMRLEGGPVDEVPVAESEAAPADHDQIPAVQDFEEEPAPQLEVESKPAQTISLDVVIKRWPRVRELVGQTDKNLPRLLASATPLATRHNSRAVVPRLRRLYFAPRRRVSSTTRLKSPAA